jgi:hypothetical protein
MGGGFSMFLDVLDAIKSPIRPDLGPLARDRADSPFRWASGRDLEDFSMQGIGPQSSDLA